jgi:FkbM family methyltransferase
LTQGSSGADWGIGVKVTSWQLFEILFPKAHKKVSSQISSYYSLQPSCQVKNLDTLFEIFFGQRDHGTFVEVGANDGISCSNTWGLSERGWRGYMVEPIPSFARECRENHKGHPAVSVHETAIGNREGVEIKFNIAGMLTTANTRLKAEYKTIDWSKNLVTEETKIVVSQSLDTFLVDNGVEAGFDLLVVDVEGFEKEVFSGFSLQTWLPKMLIVELADTHPNLNSTRTSDAKLGLEIAQSGYLTVYKDWINTVFVRRDVWEEAYV